MVDRRVIVKAVEELDKKIKQWDRGTDQELSPEIVQGIRALGELTQTEDVEPAAYELVLAIDDFVIETDKWWRELDLNRQVDNSPTRLGGSDRMWIQWGQVLKAAPARQRDLPHPALLLKDQKVRDDIICHKYRFFDDRGRPDTTKLYEHLMAERADNGGKLRRADRFHHLVGHEILRRCRSRQPRQRQRARTNHT